MPSLTRLTPKLRGARGADQENGWKVAVLSSPSRLCESIHPRCGLLGLPQRFTSPGFAVSLPPSAASKVPAERPTLLSSRALPRCLLFALISVTLVMGCAGSPEPHGGVAEPARKATAGGAPTAGLTDDQRKTMAAEKLADELAKGAGSKANDELLDELLEKTGKSKGDDQN